METQHMHIFKSGKKLEWKLCKWNGREWEIAIEQAPNLEQTWYSLKIPSRRLILNTLHYLNSTLNVFSHAISLRNASISSWSKKEQMQTNFTLTFHEQFKFNLPSHLWNLPWFPLQTETLTMLWAATMSCNITYCCKGEKNSLFKSTACLFLNPDSTVEVMRFSTNIF